MVNYSETIKVYDIKVGIHSKLNEYREVYLYQRSNVILWSLSEIAHSSLISNSFCSEATGHTEVSLHTEPS